MNPSMTPDIFWLTLTILFTACLWFPYILKLLGEVTLAKAMKAGDGTPSPEAPWAARLKRAHANAVENLVIFAPLVLIVSVFGINTAGTALAAMIYFFARVAHAVIYALGIPVLRGVSFLVGVGCQIFLALTILGVV